MLPTGPPAGPEQLSVFILIIWSLFKRPTERKTMTHQREELFFNRWPLTIFGCNSSRLFSLFFSLAFCFYFLSSVFFLHSNFSLSRALQAASVFLRPMQNAGPVTGQLVSGSYSLVSAAPSAILQHSPTEERFQAALLEYRP